MTAATKDLRCPDCQVERNQPHEIGCDVARCPVCGMQQLQCREHEFAEVFSIWTGIWPGTEECRQEDWWVYWDDRHGWIPCPADHPAALPDLNRLAIAAARRAFVWSREHQQWVRP
jgi:hypothetical protein